ncbi:MAG: hypothetical protein ACOYNY_23380 [Caldilineaceae bacterium]|jgi:hypothetical protein
MTKFERVGYKWWHLVLLLGVFFLVLPGRILAAGVGQEPPPNDVQPTTDALHSGSQGPDAPHAPVNTTLLDFQLPGTQPGGLTAPLASPASYQTTTSEYLDFLTSEANFTVADAVRRRSLLRVTHRVSARSVATA